MNSATYDIGSSKRCVETWHEPHPALNAGLVGYQSVRDGLWDIHQFVEKVLATDKPGFEISVGKWGRRSIKPLSLAKYYRLIQSYVARLYPLSKRSRYLALFWECCIELGLLDDCFSAVGHIHRPGMNGAELYNAFLELIRYKARTKPEYIRAYRYASNYDQRMFKSLKEYVDDLFLRYSKLLVVRLDVEYTKEHASVMTFDQAHKDITRLINSRRWHRAFKECVGYIVAREYGHRGAGYHFHCFFFYNGQKQNKDFLLAKAIGKYCWEDCVTRLSSSGKAIVSRGKHFNCNAKRQHYAHNGIGMVVHSDEGKRVELLYALLYLAKNDQELTCDAPSRSRSFTKGVLPKMRRLKTRGGRKCILDP